jgi:hypothetical protein
MSVCKWQVNGENAKYQQRSPQGQRKKQTKTKKTSRSKGHLKRSKVMSIDRICQRSMDVAMKVMGHFKGRSRVTARSRVTSKVEGDVN